MKKIYSHLFFCLIFLCSGIQAHPGKWDKSEKEKEEEEEEKYITIKCARCEEKAQVPKKSIGKFCIPCRNHVPLGLRDDPTGTDIYKASVKAEAEAEALAEARARARAQARAEAQARAQLKTSQKGGEKRRLTIVQAPNTHQQPANTPVSDPLPILTLGSGSHFPSSIYNPYTLPPPGREPPDGNDKFQTSDITPESDTTQEPDEADSRDTGFELTCGFKSLPENLKDSSGVRQITALIPWLENTAGAKFPEPVPFETLSGLSPEQKKGILKQLLANHAQPGNNDPYMTESGFMNLDELLRSGKQYIIDSSVPDWDVTVGVYQKNNILWLFISGKDAKKEGVYSIPLPLDTSSSNLQVLGQSLALFLEQILGLSEVDYLLYFRTWSKYKTG